MIGALDPVDLKLLDGWQRNFPLVRRPFDEIARESRLSEPDVLERLRRLRDAGAITRIGATCRPNTVGASTLAAVAAPEQRLDDIAQLITAEPGVNHSYQRENFWNIWFVATGPDRADVDATLDRIRARTGLRVLDLPLVRAFNVDLGFSLDGPALPAPRRGDADPTAIRPSDRQIIQSLSVGLELVPRPFLKLAEQLNRREDDVLGRIAALAEAGILSRIGVIVRHRALGWRSNAMVVWAVPDEDIESTGRALTNVPGVTLCYQRRVAPVLWPYTLYCMIHARSRPDAMAVLDRAMEIKPLSHVPRQVLFSVRCFKQTGALIAKSSEVAA